MYNKIFTVFVLVLSFQITHVFGQNQTNTTSPVLPSDHLPFQVSIELADFSLPNGIHSFASASYAGKWVFLCGRTNGMHTFNNNDNNFPPQQQNTVVYVVDPKHGTVFTKSLTDPTSHLSQHQIDLLSVTSPQSYRWKDILYISGGYGVDTDTGEFSTKPYLTAIYLPGLIRWVHDTGYHEKLSDYIHQTYEPALQVTGGYMTRVDKDLTLLIFGQNFAGYYLASSNGDYTQQVRKFCFHDAEKHLRVEVKTPEPQNPNYRRRDLNVVPIMQKVYGTTIPAYVALSGVFTIAGGIWNVPVLIATDGSSYMMDPNDPAAFKQGMNNYACPSVGLFSEKHDNMYTVLFGGLSYGYFENGVFETDEEIPFINQVTTVKLDRHGVFSQYLMNGQYPLILSTASNPGNQLLFGAGAGFMPSGHLDTYSNSVIKLDKVGKDPIVIGYIVGGIQSTLPNTNVASDSAASPYIFKVTLLPR